MYENVIRSVDEFIRYAVNEAFYLKDDYIGTEHILLAFLKINSRETESLISAGANYNSLKSYLIDKRGFGNFSNVASKLSKNAKKVVDNAMDIAMNSDNIQVLPCHLLISLMELKVGLAYKMLIETNVSPESILADIKEKIHFENDSDITGEVTTETLEKYTVNLNERAKNGKIDQVIGRDKEIDRILQILLRRTKNNPILIGEAGVGKTAIVEGLALRIVEGKVPEFLENKTIYSLDLPAMLAGSKYRGDFEKRVKDTLDEIMKNKNVIIFIDEFHNIVGTGGSEGSIDAANILKPFLARGEVQLIGATTTDEYRKYIEKDSALERRLQPIEVSEPTVSQTINILLGLREKYEKHHGILITDEAIKAAVELSNRYLTDRFLPDKAIDLIDEAGSMLRIKSYLNPDDIIFLKDENSKLKADIKKFVANQEFLKAQEYKNRYEQNLEEIKKLKEIKKDKKNNENLTLKYDDIAKVVSDWSKVPVNKLTVEESQKYLSLSDNLKNIVIGQGTAIDRVTSAIKRSRAGVSLGSKPIGSFIFVGATGVGKTYLAKSLANLLFESEENMIRIDMSEYMEKHTVSKLVGSPPGYVGYGEGGYLTEAVRRRPYSVVLFDEIEKAHPDVFNMLLQILDDGRLTDAQGKTVNFKNTVIIMTSNVGASAIEKKNTLGFSSKKDEVEKEYDRIKDIVNSELKIMFKPEFLNRVDDIIVFSRLDEKDIFKITELLLEKLKKRLKNIGLNVGYSNKIIKKLSDMGYDKSYGARPLERIIKSELENKIADEILKNQILSDEKLFLDVKKGNIVLEKVKIKTK
ncbi:ATP-dependent Clp protease ATP-binding subunit [Parvimonas micra]|uniref:ATP-dependent Clp protease ATP-binding subunit n=1 Tax=Parvimonas micra TaxID=33033 RepID=A0A9X3HAD4_9FIRM|nr:ATP-dependent Clp protease ATP-binding subunit [Parvimonas micra]MCZ7407690.1 ATP-dependent Clp protease ATP-binding subunit [Parvimonas micra]MCZ7410685.1 ATP-dependent Clp protease ATP-binding subunit [Parvimonas micra]MCZ7412593.1 ATP-dependent Clp protease ATP-binding subunit [Parvimonas micra]WBB36350.1 ATP-dependent Clp protease ATP-binding subunit [Parvimonas micra]